MDRVTIAVVLSLLMSGCIHDASAWRRANGTSAQAEDDLRQCKYESDLATTQLTGIEAGVKANQLKISCMRARGYNYSGS